MRLRVEERARLLADLASALTVASTDLDSVLDCAVRATSTLIGDGGLIRLANDDGIFDRAAVHHPDAELAGALRQLLPALGQRADEGFAGEVRRSGAAVVRNDIDGERLRRIVGPAIWPHLARLDIGAILMVPLVADGTYLGNLSASRSGRDRPYTDQDTQLAVDIAARVALAVTTAQVVARLRAERENYRQIVETGFDGVWKLDRDGVTTFANDRMAGILGVGVADLLGRPAIQWLAEDDRDEHERRLVQRRAGRPDHYEVRLRRADGELVWARLTASPVHDEAGAVVGSLAMVTDITDRLHNRELQDRLAQMQRLDSLGQLVGGIAHDFNNLLTIIGGATDLILTELPPHSPLTVLARQVATAAEHGATLTRQLLTFGRGQPGRAEIIDVAQVVAELAPMLQRTLGEHLHLRTPPAREGDRPCRVRIDRGQLQQVIINLAANARDAMRTGGTLTIEYEHTQLDAAELGPAGGEPGSDPDGAKAWFVRLAVSDTGPGMDPETLRRALEPFYTTKPAGQGTGLGLANVYGIIRAADGLVRLYSEPGHGLTVKLYLRAYDSPAYDSPAHDSPAHGSPAHGSPAHGSAARGSPADDELAHRLIAPGQTAPAVLSTPTSMRILVVEDTPELADVLRRLLQPAGYQVEVAHNPLDALARLDAGLRVDLVLTDVVMPDLTGPELAARIRTHQPDLPVVYTSGYTAGTLGARADLDPDAIIVEKPFTRTTLLSALIRALPQP